MKTISFFKSIKRFFLLVTILCFGFIVSGQVSSVPDTSKMTYNQISNGLKLYVFPSKGQSQQKQKEDEFECYKWAMQQSGIDPLNLPKVEAKPAETGPDGSAVRGAARGAAACIRSFVSLPPRAARTPLSTRSVIGVSSRGIANAAEWM